MAFVLIVDDKPDIAKAVAALIPDGGHEVAVAHSGAAALHVLLDRPVDLMVLDVVMPGMSGMDLLRSLAEQDRLDCTPVAMFSANDEYRDESLRLGAVDYVLKEHFDDLLGFVERHADRRQDRAA
jgi:DNA-binding response OmpR family regulator